MIETISPWILEKSERTAPAWHPLGVFFEQPEGAQLALKKAGLDYLITRKPMFYTCGTETIWIPDRYALVRENLDLPWKSKFFGVVSERYHIIQNADIARSIEPFTEKYPVECCAEFDDGKTVFFALRAPEPTYLGGEEIINYFMITDTRDGRNNLKILYTPVLVGSYTTLSLGNQIASVNIDIGHSKDSKMDLKFYAKALHQFETTMETAHEKFHQMTKWPMSPKDIEEYFSKVYPDPMKPKRLQTVDSLAGVTNPGSSEYARKINENRNVWIQRLQYFAGLRKLGVEAYEQFNRDHPDFSGSLWGAYVAATEVSDWRIGRGKQEISVLFGDRAQEKKRAFSVAMETCT